MEIKHRLIKLLIQLKQIIIIRLTIIFNSCNNSNINIIIINYNKILVRRLEVLKHLVSKRMFSKRINSKEHQHRREEPMKVTPERMLMFKETLCNIDNKTKVQLMRIRIWSGQVCTILGNLPT